jgi:hypothetical protein
MSLQNYLKEEEKEKPTRGRERTIESQTRKENNFKVIFLKHLVL